MGIVLSNKGFGRSPDRATICSGYPKPPFAAIFGPPRVAPGPNRGIMINDGRPAAMTAR